MLPDIIVPWMVQWYAYVPAAVNVRVYVPLPCVGEWTPSSNVTLWLVPPLSQVHVTVVPAAIWSDGGVNLSFDTMTALGPGGSVMTAPLLELDPHAVAAATENVVNAMSKLCAMRMLPFLMWL
jgi:hypothetical protein